jgi:hypothetical protein
MHRHHGAVRRYELVPADDLRDPRCHSRGDPCVASFGERLAGLVSNNSFANLLFTRTS